jgi:hypothetical protein
MMVFFLNNVPGWLMREPRRLFNFWLYTFSVCFLPIPENLKCGVRKKCRRKPVTRHLSLENCTADEVVLQVTPTSQCVTVH